jgi:radical SAM superfamily enzyme YgiQ (UPF0313 family)
LSQCIKQILSKKPKIVGFTVYESNFTLCHLIASSLKKNEPKLIILFGGPTPSVQPDTVLKHYDFVDGCVRHEGEETCLELLRELDAKGFKIKKADLTEIKGLSYRFNGKIYNNPPRDLLLINKKIPDFLDKYPSPYLTGILKTSQQGIITARGCSQHCVYCNCAAVSKRSIAFHSIDRVIEELDYISKTNGFHKRVEIFDDTFTMIPNRAKEICNRIIENKIKLSLSCATRCDRVDEELLDKMKEAGFNSLGFSLESGVPRILRNLGKVQPPGTKTDPLFQKETEFIQKFKKYTRYCKKIGIKFVFASIMLGLPGETLAEGQQTVVLIRSLQDSLDYYAHNIFVVYPGTPVFSTYDQYGLQLEKYDNQVQHRTLHAYDTSKINMAPKSNHELDSISQDKNSLKALSLPFSEEKSLNAFKKIILDADNITEEMVLWMQESIELNGPLIQIYSNAENAERNHFKNQHALSKYISPTAFCIEYYKTIDQEGITSLIPFRTLKYDKNCGFPINLVNTTTVINGTKDSMNPFQSTCIDRTKEDTEQLHRLLVDLMKKDNPVNNLFNTKIYPYFCHLCRWENKLPNCRSLDTIIVDGNNNLKTCWMANPIGQVGMTFSEILDRVQNLFQEVQQKRDCFNCKKRFVCVKCIFPQPLADSEYCKLKKDYPVEEAAALLRAFDFFKEI